MTNRRESKPPPKRSQMLATSLFPGMEGPKAGFESHDPTVEVPYSYASYSQPIRKCTRDNREFKVIVLENQLEIMIINDSEATKACCAFNLLAGSGMDPPGLRGLANLTHHWLLRASKAYPTDNEFDNFIKEHKGVLYSHTTLKTTEVSLGLDVSALKEAMERLASHLSDPLFQRQAAEKVVHEIDLDHKRFLKQENMSIKLLERNFFKPPEKMTHFKTGNRETLLINPPKLGIDIHQEVHRYYETYYSSNLMKLVILGNQGLPTLTEWAINIFSGIYNKIVPVPQIERILLPADFNRQILVKSHQHTRSLVLLFPLFCQGGGPNSDQSEPTVTDDSVGKDVDTFSDGGDHHSPDDLPGKSDGGKHNHSHHPLHAPGDDPYTRPTSRHSSHSSGSIRSHMSTSTGAPSYAHSGHGSSSSRHGVPPFPMNLVQQQQAMAMGYYGGMPQLTAAMGGMHFGMGNYPMNYLGGGMNNFPGVNGMGNFPGANGMGNFPGANGMNNYPGANGMNNFPGVNGMNNYPVGNGMNNYLGGYGYNPNFGMSYAPNPMGFPQRFGPGQPNGHPMMAAGMNVFLNQSGGLPEVGASAAGYHPATPQLDMFRDWAPAVAYIRHLLELRTPGSLIHYLQRKGWGTYIHTADVMDMDCDTPFFKMSVSLTKAGFDAYEEVIRAVFQYAHMIRRAGVQPWLFDEIRSIAAIKFFMRAKYNDFDGPRFAEMMCRDDLSPNMYVCDQAMYYECQEDVIQQVLSCFHPKNFAVLVVSRDIESPGMSRELYYETKYQITSLPLTLQMALGNLKRNDKFYLPIKNPYIIESWTSPGADAPLSTGITVISESTQSRCRFYRTNTYTPARTNVHLDLQSPLAFKSPATAVRSHIMAKLFQERCKKLIDSSSAAGAASMFHTIESGPDGIQISLEGFNEKLDLLLNNVFAALNDIKVDPYRLKYYIDEYMMDINENAGQSAEDPTAFIEHSLRGHSWPHEAMLGELKTITVSDMTLFIQNYLSRTFIEMFVTGNILELEAQDWLRIAERNVRRTTAVKVDRYVNAAHHLPLGSRMLHRLMARPETTASKVAYFVEVGSTSEARLRVYQDLIARIVEDKCLTSFVDQLHLTNLECVVLCKPNLPLGLVLAATANKDPTFLESGMELCLQTIKRHLLDMSPIALEGCVERLREEKQAQAAKATSLQLWQGLVYECPSVYQAEELDILASINKAGLMEFFKRYFDKSNRYLTKLSVHISPHDKMPMMEGQKFVKDVAHLKSMLQASDMSGPSGIPQ
ncbi:metalloprotease [Tieghemiomyces parasiticus]|uniref:Metalloprotease n=1 Tax=Tieghemiomyces parasiticus TaxID=78921 RepID=A0A9W8DYQ6_9FUNG|nr:metalloprotease [Tieghemiomyces parasiticus]